MAGGRDDRTAPPGPGQQTAQRPPRPQQGPPQAQQAPPAQRQQAPAPSARPQTAQDDGREDTAVRPFTQRVAEAVSNAARPPQKGESRGAGAALVTGENRAVQPRRASSAARPPRRARLRLTRVDPWSVTKTSFLLSLAFGVVTLVAVLIVWSVLGAAGVWESINATVASVLDGESTSDFDVENYVGTSRILGFTTLVTILNVFLITAVATLAAFMYNLAAALLGGIEVTLAEDEK